MLRAMPAQLPPTRSFMQSFHGESFASLPPASSFCHAAENAGRQQERPPVGRMMLQLPVDDFDVGCDATYSGGASASRCDPTTVDTWCTPEASEWLAHRQRLKARVASGDIPRVITGSYGASPFRSLSVHERGGARHHGVDNGAAYQHHVDRRFATGSFVAPITATSSSFAPVVSVSTVTSSISFVVDRRSDHIRNSAAATVPLQGFVRSRISDDDLDSTTLPSASSQHSPRKQLGPQTGGQELSGAGRPGGAASPLPKPVASRRCRQPHLLDVELQEVTLHAEATPGASAAWYELVKCFVSLHPSSAKLPASGGVTVPPPEEFPAEVPTESVEGSHLVSQAVLLRQSEKDGEGKMVLTAKLDEQLTLRTERLDTHCVLYLWCRKQSVFGEEVSLLGSRVLPLRDTSLYGRLAAWDVASAASTNEQVGEVHMRCSVATAPGAIQLPHLLAAEPTSVEFHWSPPLRTNGRPIIGYTVAVLEPSTEEWITLCECAASTSFVMRNLLPTTTYLVDVRAINEVGVGEHTELEFTTAALGNTEVSDAESADVDSFLDSDSMPPSPPRIESFEAPALDVATPILFDAALTMPPGQSPPTPEAEHVSAPSLYGSFAGSATDLNTLSAVDARVVSQLNPEVVDDRAQTSGCTNYVGDATEEKLLSPQRRKNPPPPEGVSPLCTPAMGDPDVPPQSARLPVYERSRVPRKSPPLRVVGWVGS